MDIFGVLSAHSFIYQTNTLLLVMVLQMLNSLKNMLMLLVNLTGGTEQKESLVLVIKGIGRNLLLVTQTTMAIMLIKILN